MKHINQMISTVKENSPTLYWIVVIHFILAAVCVLGLAVDDRILAGINVWIKPLKFSISGGIYIFTLGYLINFYPYSSRKKNRFTWLVDSIFWKLCRWSDDPTDVS